MVVAAVSRRNAMTRFIPVATLALSAVTASFMISGCSSGSDNSNPPPPSSSGPPAASAAPKVDATIPVGKSPLGVAIDSGAHRAYVTNSGAKSVSVIDTASNAVVGAPITVGEGPDGVAGGPATPTGYVTNIEDETGAGVDTTPNAGGGGPHTVRE